MKKIFKKYFPLFNWTAFYNGQIIIEDVRKHITEEQIAFFVEHQGTEKGKTMEFNCKNNYRIVGVRSNFYAKLSAE